jgi:ERCC4-type nuclease
MLLQVTELTSAINDYGIMAVLVAVLLISVYFLFRLFVRQTENMQKIYIDLLDKQEENCGREMAIIRNDLQDTKRELKDYKNEDKQMILQFVNTLSKDSTELKKAMIQVSKSVNALSSEIKKH